MPENVVAACESCNSRRKSRSAAAYLRARAREGRVTAEPELLVRALELLAECELKSHRDYALRQLGILQGWMSSR